MSTDGGELPVWSPDGRTVYYRAGNTTMAVEVTLADPPDIGVPRPGFELREATQRRAYDIAPDGSGFIFVVPGPTPPDGKVNFVLDWFGEVRQSMSVDR